MSLPIIRDYSFSVKRPELCFEDGELKAGKTEFYTLGARKGSPQQWVGQFTTVYKIHSNGKTYAVRCFTRESAELATRYEKLKEYLHQSTVPGFVRVEYQPNGIKVISPGEHQNRRFPIVKMEWVDGETLDTFVGNNLRSPGTVSRLADNWLDTARQLQSLPMAHNDLQHGNIMVRGDGSIRLVDYDGVFLPAFQGQQSPEEGHKHYQHPDRSSEHYDETIDNFPAIVIYVSLLAVAAKPALWRFYNQDNLLFTKGDFNAPDSSELFQELHNIQDNSVADLAGKLAGWCANPIELVPTIDEFLSVNPPKVPARRPRSRSVAPPRVTPRQAASQGIPSRIAPLRDINREDFLRFCGSLQGQQIQAPLGAVFTVSVVPLGIEIRQGRNSRPREIDHAKLDAVLREYKDKGSFSSVGYSKAHEGSASYVLPILRKYIYDNPDRRPPSPATNRPTPPSSVGGRAKPPTETSPPVNLDPKISPTSNPASRWWERQGR